MEGFKINFLDHVAIRVSDLSRSVEWYERILGLKKYQLEEWGEFPIFMLAGKSGVAIFPADLKDSTIDSGSRNVKIDHFAFNVSNEDFEKAKLKFNMLNEAFSYQDHHYFESIYLNDPDGHCVELTTILVDENSFYAD